MKLLLHTCCAPCLIFPLRRLKESGFIVSGYFYNPNIHPFSEYKNRLEALRMVSTDIEMSVPEYRPQDFFQAVNLKEEAPGRCSLCWRLRLGNTAKTAKDKGFTHFTTTLLVSPYQDQKELIRIAEEVAAATGVEFYKEDFRPGFREAHDEVKSKGIYCQKYCGCIYSETERGQKTAKALIG